MKNLSYNRQTEKKDALVQFAKNISVVEKKRAPAYTISDEESRGYAFNHRCAWRHSGVERGGDQPVYASHVLSLRRMQCAECETSHSLPNLRNGSFDRKIMKGCLLNSLRAGFTRLFGQGQRYFVRASSYRLPSSGDES
jgi:hypothetical protein